MQKLFEKKEEREEKKKYEKKIDTKVSKIFKTMGTQMLV